MRVCILGCGFLGEKIAALLRAKGIEVVATVRCPERAAQLARQGVQAFVAPDPRALPKPVRSTITHLIDSIPPTQRTVPQRIWLQDLIKSLPRLAWAGYLSSTGVYGDHEGNWVDEEAVLKARHPRAQARIEAERCWQKAFASCEVFRLSGLYAPERSIVPKLLAGDYIAVRFEPPRWSNRIHADDAACAIVAAIEHPRAGRIVNLADDLPLPHADYACELASRIGAPPPRIVRPEEMRALRGAHYLSFFSDNKRVQNARLHEELLPQLRYPSFREAACELAKAAQAGTALAHARRRQNR